MTETDIQHCRHCRFSVAGFTFSVGIPSSVDADRLLPSFRDFRCGGQALPERDIFRMEQSLGTLRPDTGLRFIEETGTDIGLTCLYEAGQKYYLEIRHTDGSPVHQMLASKDFSRVEARIDWTDRYAGNSLCSMLRIPVAMHNVPEKDIFRPASWAAFGMDKEGQDYRACAAYGPLYK